ncbi:DUF1501 domain-containing protein [Sanyastnella coralliicola]|uniref:DUF1501 domain-containing protein n=1 Tax=Sanyastnella coralliicola TaxID=3069118 RepID=UPI0027BA17AF|nr:DUF1501 domain-containing protein [Longitalea sp. SCSIO 12813]
MKRRDFLRFSAVATGATLMPQFLSASNPVLSAIGAKGKRLVVIQLSGGNDSLNMLVPFRNDTYYKERPKIAIAAKDVLRLTSEVGLNPAMTGLQELYDQGYLTLINGVGYPNPNRSHFRSMEIWQTASDSDQTLQSGWVGRFLDTQPSTLVHPYSAIEMEDALSLVMQGNEHSGLAAADPARLKKVVNHPFIRQVADHNHGHHHHPQVDFLHETLDETVNSVDYIAAKARSASNQMIYPATALAHRLKTVAGLINADADTQVYYMSQGSYDTHANQLGGHARLLGDLSNALKAFVLDLKASGRLDDTLVMVFSEFGRRVKQNAGRGTDHGTAGTMMLLGGKLKNQGVYNDIPSLSDLDDGDLKHSIDFRSVYRNVLEDWLQTPSEDVLFKKFERLDIV